MDRRSSILLNVLNSSSHLIETPELTRRALLRLGLVSFAGLAVAGGIYPRRVIASEGHGLNPDKALTMLMEGNARYVEGKMLHPNQAADRMGELAKGQHPFAVILGCADSRVPPEIVFDQGLGDLFVLRVAGNIADDAVIGSIEYAVEHLGTTLVFVLGHERCGAVSAAVEVVTKGAKVPGHIGS
ncbi:MAG TPA: carbonic anhydrase, partial [Nitrospiria bacterium]